MRSPSALAARAIGKLYMTDLIRITESRVSNEGTLDWSTGGLTLDEPSEVYYGEAQVDVRVTGRESPGLDTVVADSVIRIPNGDHQLRAGQAVTILASRDPLLVRAVFRLDRVVLGSIGIVRELECSIEYSLPTGG